jgi:hypothetical protein
MPQPRWLLPLLLAVAVLLMANLVRIAVPAASGASASRETASRTNRAREYDIISSGSTAELVSTLDQRAAKGWRVAGTAIEGGTMHIILER